MVLSMMVISIFTIGCTEDSQDAAYPVIDRESKIPADGVKMTPESDVHPPVLHSDEFEDPVPLRYPINTAGGEDSPYILDDGNTLYFFFTPDVSIPAEKQVIDDVTVEGKGNEAEGPVEIGQFAVGQLMFPHQTRDGVGVVDFLGDGGIVRVCLHCGLLFAGCV